MNLKNQIDTKVLFIFPYPQTPEKTSKLLNLFQIKYNYLFPFEIQAKIKHFENYFLRIIFSFQKLVKK